LYKQVVALIRAYANHRERDGEAGYTQEEADPGDQAV
jgi:hypothetical protein